jgi:hypothetical protein
LDNPEEGLTYPVKKYGVFHTLNTVGTDRIRATNFLTRQRDRTNSQAICQARENYRRALKELFCVKVCKIRNKIRQLNLINGSLRVFIPPEAAHPINKITIYNAKGEIVKLPSPIIYVVIKMHFIFFKWGLRKFFSRIILSFFNRGNLGTLF